MQNVSFSLSMIQENEAISPGWSWRLKARLRSGPKSTGLQPLAHGHSQGKLPLQAARSSHTPRHGSLVQCASWLIGKGMAEACPWWPLLTWTRSCSTTFDSSNFGGCSGSLMEWIRSEIPCAHMLTNVIGNLFVLFIMVITTPQSTRRWAG